MARLIHRPEKPSAGINYLVSRTGPDTIGVCSEYCPESSINFVGSALIAVLAGQLAQIATANSQTVSEYILRPYSLEQSVRPLSYYDLKSDQERLLSTKRPRYIDDPIFWKRTCGYDLGVVLTGKYTGLVVSGSRNIPGALRIERLWNDYSSHRYRKKPYLNKFKKEYGYESDTAKQLQVLVFRRLDELRKLFPYVSSLFTFLCKELAIPIDESRFHATIDSRTKIKSSW